MINQQVLEKLKKIKALADRGIGGERENALKLYNELVEKYDIQNEDLEAEEIKQYWFSYKNSLEKTLLIQVIYSVVGNSQVWRYKDGRRKKIGEYCTKAEAIEIEIRYNFYKDVLEKELDIFMNAFISANRIYPDKNARCYKEPEEKDRKLTPEEKKAIFMSQCIDRKIPPKKLLED